MLISDSCDFCNEFAGLADNAFAVRYGCDLRDRIVFESNSFKILPSLGQIVPGYLLIVPQQHYRAIGDMENAALRELENLRAMMLADLSAANGTYVFFEHGTRTTDCGGCGITHAHLHAVPFSQNADPVQVLKEQFPFDIINVFADLSRAPAGSSYLYYEATSRDRYIFYPSFIPSQYVRRLLSEAAGTQDWDWRACGKEARFIATFSQTAQHFARQCR